MKNFIINKTINFITSQKDYDKTTIEELRYGLVSIYLTFSKFIIISALAIILGIFKEMLVLLIIYNILRVVSFGLHASKTWICLVSSILIFIVGPIVCMNIEINNLVIAIISIITIPIIYRYSPADTKKRPIVNPRRRKVFKYLSTIFALVFCIVALTINNSFIINCLMLSLIIQCIVIHPYVYKLFGMSYDNYKNFKMN